MTIEQQTDQVAQALDLLIAQYKGKLTMADILNSWTQQVQELEDAFFQLLEDRTLGTGVGVQLDVLGAIVGQERLSSDDDQYLLRIKARIKINISSGTAEQLIEILNLLIDNDFNNIEWFPSAFCMVVHDELTDDPDVIADMIADARLGGVNGCIEYTLTDDDYTFTFATGDSIEVDADRGFSNDAGGQPGGVFADAIGA